MQRQMVVVALVTAVIFAVAGWFVGLRQPGKVTVLKHQHNGQDCRAKGTCQIEINIDNCDSAHPDPTTCDVYSVEELTLIDSNNGKIDFKIATNGFAFDQRDGIKFTSYNSGDQYFPCNPQGQGFTCQNKIPSGTPGAGYKYVIHVVNLGYVDPWIVSY
jgi:hypothetical protein